MEKRVYLIDLDNATDDINTKKTSDEVWVRVSAKQGNIYTLDSFCHAFNWDEVNQGNSYIRII